MAYDGVEPIGNVKGPIGSGLDIDGTKTPVTGADEWGEILGAMAGPIGSEGHTVDDVGKVTSDEGIALYVEGQVRGVDDFDDHAFDGGVTDIHGGMVMVSMDHDWEQFAEGGAAAALDEGFAPGMVSHAPGVLTAASAEGV